MHAILRGNSCYASRGAGGTRVFVSRCGAIAFLISELFIKRNAHPRSLFPPVSRETIGQNVDSCRPREARKRREIRDAGAND